MVISSLNANCDVRQIYAINTIIQFTIRQIYQLVSEVKGKDSENHEGHFDIYFMDFQQFLRF